MEKLSKGRPNKRLRHERENRNWSQKNVAEKVGTTVVNVSRWERGITAPSPYFRHQLCITFETSSQSLGLVQDVSESEASDAIFDPVLPLPLTRQQALIGRESEMASLKQHLLQGEYPALLALHGLPGVGKTSLSVALAYDPHIQAYFDDGILWADLGPYPNVLGLLSRWGNLLGVTVAETHSDNWLLALRMVLRSRRMLFIIDDAWDLKDVLALKVGGPNCAYLVTTRFPQLALRFADTNAMLIHELDEGDSIALLRQLVPDVLAREPEAVQALISLVGGLPLGLALMGKYLQAQGYGGQTRRIHQALDRLHIVQERLTLQEPQRLMGASLNPAQEESVSLRTVIAMSELQLSDQAKDALRALSVFPAKPNSFTEEAALAICKAPVKTLDILSDAGLLESRGSNRYTLHQTIADYAKASLVDTNAFVRLVEYFVDYVEANSTACDLLEQEASNILAALETASTLGRLDDFVRGVCVCIPFLENRGLYNLGEKLLQQAQTAAQTLQDRSSQVNILLGLGNIAEKQGKYTQAATYLQEGLELAQQAGKCERVCAFLRSLGVVIRRSGDYSRAESYFQDSLALARKLGHVELVCSLLALLGGTACEQGKYAQGEAFLQEGLELARQLGNRESICFLLSTRGLPEARQGRLAQAESYLQEGLALARQLGDRERICTILNNLGALLMEHQAYAQAESYLQEGLVLARSLGHAQVICLLLVNLAVISREREDYRQAIKHLDECQSLAQEIGYFWMIGVQLIERGEIYLKQQQFGDASSSFHQALKSVSQENQEMIAQIQYGLARVAAAQGKIHEACQQGQESLSLFDAMGHVRATEVRDWLLTLS